MKTMLWMATLSALAASCEASALGSLATVAVIDRDTGELLSAQYSRGEYWVAGRPGRRYAIELRNTSGGRVLAVTSVDGVNVLSGETAGWEQAGYVLGAGESYQVTGWRKSNAEVAAFTFTDSPSAYAERTGRPANVGVIGVALFRERVPEPVHSYRGGEEPAMPGAPSAARPREDLASSLDSVSGGASAGSPANGTRNQAAAKLGTGHGAREGSQVAETQFVRAQSAPNEVIRIRYDSLDNLIAMGVIRRPRPLVPAVNPFPDSRARQFVPDPPG